MSRQDEIRNGIRRLAGGAVPMLLRMGTITAVDETAQTCTVHIDDGYDLDDVRLTPVEDAESFPPSEHGPSWHRSRTTST